MLDVVLEVCDVVSSRDSAQREVSLNALERVAKGTALGHLLPVLVCCLNHPSLKSLSLAENLVSHLVLLTVLTSKVSCSSLLCACLQATLCIALGSPVVEG